jgi:hypothetical protein
MIFIAWASALKSAEELGELIEALERQPKEVRDRYLGIAARPNQSLHLMVAASWLVEVKRLGFDAHAATATYRKLNRTQPANDNHDLAVELLCAEAGMFDEYGVDKDRALEVLRVAQELSDRLSTALSCTTRRRRPTSAMPLDLVRAHLRRVQSPGAHRRAELFHQR